MMCDEMQGVPGSHPIHWIVILPQRPMSGRRHLNGCTHKGCFLHGDDRNGSSTRIDA